MGITFLEIKVCNPAAPKRSAVVKMLVDSGASYSVVPQSVLKKLGIKATGKRSFFLANGEKTERQMGNAIFEYKGANGATPVIFGKKGDSELLGAPGHEWTHGVRIHR